MTTDTRELLELAAKACGMNVLSPGMPWLESEGWFYNEHEHGGGMFSHSLERSTQSRWNPLKDDGDALRLAVALKLNVYTYGISAVGVACHLPGSNLSMTEAVHNDDYLTATRLAIVKAAAEIGRRMP